jgi:hypothetical protein
MEVLVQVIKKYKQYTEENHKLINGNNYFTQMHENENVYLIAAVIQNDFQFLFYVDINNIIKKYKDNINKNNDVWKRICILLNI